MEGADLVAGEEDGTDVGEGDGGGAVRLQQAGVQAVHDLAAEEVLRGDGWQAATVAAVVAPMPKGGGAGQGQVGG